MSKTAHSLRSAIQDLNIQKPFPTRPSQKEAPQPEAPRNEGLRSETINGFFMMAHRIFSEPVVRELPGDCFRVFLWMSAQAYRFRSSSGTVRASAKFVSAGVGIAESSVSRAFDILIRAKLIRRAEINYKLGNLWWVSPMAFGGGDRPINALSQDRAPEREASQDKEAELPVQESSSPKPSEKESQSRGENNTSQELKETFLSYFSSLKPEGKRKSEWKAFQSLKSEFTEEEIEMGLKYLMDRDPNLTKYHSPFAYLAVALPQVLKAAKTTPRSPMGFKAPETEENESAEERLWKSKEEAFQRAFPSLEAQADAIARIMFDVNGSSPLCGSMMKRGLAICRWWDDLNRITEPRP